MKTNAPTDEHAPHHAFGAKRVRRVGRTKRIEVTLVLSPADSSGLRNELDRQEGCLPCKRPQISHSAFLALREPHADHVESVREFAKNHNLGVVEVSRARHDIRLKGTVAAMEHAFSVDLAQYEHEAGHYLSHDDSYVLPDELTDVVTCVLGLDESPVRTLPASAWGNHKEALWPQDVAKIYHYPADATGAGQRIAVLEFGGGYKQSDLKAYAKKTGRPAPQVEALSVLDAKNRPLATKKLHAIISAMNKEMPMQKLFSKFGADLPKAIATIETTTDIEILATVAPAAKLEVHFAPNTSTGYYQAIHAALNKSEEPPTAISISWGGAERSLWTKSHIMGVATALEAARLKGVTVCCASGDFGSSGDQGSEVASACFPASSPNVLACGGTTIKLKSDKRDREKVWTTNYAGMQAASGGGVSALFPLPQYQKGAKVPKPASLGDSVWKSSNDRNFRGRGVPDVAAHSVFRAIVGGKKTIADGTSAAAPMWAGLIALLGERLGEPPGWINDHLYDQGDEELFKDIREGSNDITNGEIGLFDAKKGWDACTGLGSPHGEHILQKLKD